MRGRTSLNSVTQAYWLSVMNSICDEFYSMLLVSTGGQDRCSGCSCRVHDIFKTETFHFSKPSRPKRDRDIPEKLLKTVLRPKCSRPRLHPWSIHCLAELKSVFRENFNACSYQTLNHNVIRDRQQTSCNIGQLINVSLIEDSCPHFNIHSSKLHAAVECENAPSCDAEVIDIRLISDTSHTATVSYTQLFSIN